MILPKATLLSPHSPFLWFQVPGEPAAPPGMIYAKNGSVKQERRIVLVADDDAGMRRFVHRVLSEQGDHVVMVEDGLLAIEAWAKGDFSLLITDYQMPEHTGIEVIQRIRECGDRTPAVLMSGTLDDLAIRVCKELGGVVCLPKPFGISELRSAIERVVSLSATAPREGLTEPIRTPGDQDTRLGSLALRRGFLTAGQLRTALSIQAVEATQAKRVRQLGLILLSQGYLDGKKLQSLLQHQREARSGLV